MYQRDFLIARLNKARTHLSSLIAAAPKDKEIYPGWRLKEFVAHVTGWDDSVIGALRTHARGDAVVKSVENGIDDYNAKAVAARDAVSLELVMREYDEKRAAVLEQLRELPDEKFNLPLDFPWGEFGTVAYMIEIFVDHEDALAEHLEHWLKNPDVPLSGKH